MLNSKEKLSISMGSFYLREKVAASSRSGGFPELTTAETKTKQN
jgi:hypothetical protein